MRKLYVKFNIVHSSVQILGCYHLILLKVIAVSCSSSKKLDVCTFLKKNFVTKISCEKEHSNCESKYLSELSEKEWQKIIC